MAYSPEVLRISEQYLQEMLEADNTANFELYTQRYQQKYLQEFSRERFHNDIKGMHQRNGMNTGYEFLAEFRQSRFDGHDIYRTIWKGIYQKRDAVIELGIYQAEGTWHVILSAVH